MSIHLYDKGSLSNGWGEMVSWFNSNKNGLFSSTGVSISTSTSSNTITLSFTQLHGRSNAYASIKIATTTTKNAGVVFVGYDITGASTSTTTTLCATNTPYDSNRYLFRKCIMCGNGMLFEMGGINYKEFVDGNTFTSYDIGITFDKDEYMVLLFRAKNSDGVYALPTTGNAWSFVGRRASGWYNSFTVSPRYGSKRTTLAPVCPESFDDTNYCPNCWTATRTQLPSQGLTAVRINGVDYITNGGIYIRDTPAE